MGSLVGVASPFLGRPHDQTDSGDCGHASGNHERDGEATASGGQGGAAGLVCRAGGRS